MESTITIRIDENEKKALIELAHQLDVPFSQLAREAIKDYLKRQEEKESDDGFVMKSF